VPELQFHHRSRHVFRGHVAVDDGAIRGNFLNDSVELRGRDADRDGAVHLGLQVPARTNDVGEERPGSIIHVAHKHGEGARVDDEPTTCGGRRIGRGAGWFDAVSRFRVSGSRLA